MFTVIWKYITLSFILSQIYYSSLKAIQVFQYGHNWHQMPLNITAARIGITEVPALSLWSEIIM